jgi:hypothetical protein
MVLAIQELHPRYDLVVMLCPMGLLLPPFLVYPLFLGDLVDRPQVRAALFVQEDGLEDVVLHLGFGIALGILALSGFLAGLGVLRVRGADSSCLG